MNKRQKKKLVKKVGWKCYRYRCKNAKSLNELFQIHYPSRILKTLIYKENPFLKLIITDSSNLYHSPIILGLKKGVSFV